MGKDRSSRHDHATRVFLGWLRGERAYCGKTAIPTTEEEDAKWPSHEWENLIGWAVGHRRLS